MKLLAISNFVDLPKFNFIFGSVSKQSVCFTHSETFDAQSIGGTASMKLGKEII